MQLLFLHDCPAITISLRLWYGLFDMASTHPMYECILEGGRLVGPNALDIWITYKRMHEFTELMILVRIIR